MKQTQEQKVINQIESFGQVGRNLCLNLRITRLGAIINKLNKRGYRLKGRFVPTEFGKDYIYKPEEIKIKYQKKLL